MAPDSLSIFPAMTALSWSKNHLIFRSAVAIDRFMKLLVLASFIMGFGWALSGCLGLSCNALGCDYGVRITLKGVGLAYAASLPLDIKSCADDGACLVVKVSEANGVFACDIGDTPTFADCVVTPAGDVSLNLAFKDLPKNDAAVITVTVLDPADAMVFGAAQSVALHDIEINGPGCGVTCQRGEALFVP